MFTNITRTTLCITAFSIASLMAAPLNATKTESLDWNWKFARFGKMPDGSTQPEPGKAMGFATATSEESGNPADNAVDGDKSTRQWQKRRKNHRGHGTPRRCKNR